MSTFMSALGGKAEMSHVRGVVLTQMLRILALAIPITSVASANAQSLKDQVTGTWMLVSAEVVQSDGTRANLFGAQPRGILVLSPDGTYVTINTRNDMPRIAAGNRDKATDEEAKAITQGTLGYYGTYTVDEQKKMLTVNVTGSTFVNQIGTKQTRIITSITPTEMTFTNPAATSGGRLELRFKRP
jgi:Lipocalin-like domain